jgi:hypothetical protein
MIDPSSRAGRDLKAAEEFFELAKKPGSPFMRAYYRRVAERYLSSQGELKPAKSQANVPPSAGLYIRIRAPVLITRVIAVLSTAPISCRRAMVGVATAFRRICHLPALVDSISRPKLGSR